MNTVVSHDLMQQQFSASLQQQQPIAQPSNNQTMPTYLDEFKHGFPSNGLSSISKKWWENDNDGGKQDAEESNEELEDEKPAELSNDVEMIENANKEQSGGCGAVSFNGTIMLSSLRKRAAEEGRIVKVGIGRFCRESKVNDKHEALLKKLFGSSFPT